VPMRRRPGRAGLSATRGATAVTGSCVVAVNGGTPVAGS
jgi:hypothetical protein